MQQVFALLIDFCVMGHKIQARCISCHSNSTCRKLIGVRYISNGLIEDLRSKNPSFVVPLNLTDPRDHQGHGTHTLSTAGGNFVSNVSVYGNGFGTAKGGSPKARVAAYKVCWKPHVNDTCNSGDILAGFDLAIHDGVDVISVSMGSSTKDYFENSVAIGSFHAMMNGIIVVASAGNSGPRLSSAANTAPWLFTIGASTIDRDFMSYVTLGNKMVIKVRISYFKAVICYLDRRDNPIKVLSEY